MYMCFFFYGFLLVFMLTLYCICANVCKCLKMYANARSVAHQFSPQRGEYPSILCREVNPNPCHKDRLGLVAMAKFFIFTVLVD